MKKLLLVLCFLSAPLFAEWVQTPFGPAWIGPGPRPVEQVPVAKPKPAPFVPAYEQGVLVKCSLPQCGDSIVNEWYFATKGTADTLCKRYACSTIFLKPFGGAGGTFYATAQERWLAWPDGVTFNAGFLASYFTRNPEDKFPGLADWYINGILKQARDAKSGK